MASTTSMVDQFGSWGIMLALLLTLVGYPAMVHPQAEEQVVEKSLPSVEARKKRLQEMDLALPEPPITVAQGQDAATSEDYQQALRSYYTYRKAGYDHRLRVFEWQLLSSRIIFFVVLFLVFVGIYFAAVQFHRGAARPGKTEVSSEDMTELDLSVKGVKVRSPVLGVIILVISLAFFYLYLVYVYPIQNVF
jgi:hypothetical protein